MNCNGTSLQFSNAPGDWKNISALRINRRALAHINYTVARFFECSTAVREIEIYSQTFYLRLQTIDIKVYIAMLEMQGILNE